MVSPSANAPSTNSVSHSVLVEGVMLMDEISASGAVDERDGDGHVLFTAAGQKQQAQDRSQQHKKQVPDFFHDDPPGLKLKKTPR